MVVYLLTRAASRPATVVLVDVDAGKLQHLQHIFDQFPASSIAFERVVSRSERANDALMATLPPHSLVINATGMGKDLPGSPITAAGLFPEHGIAWELNYRGERRFMGQAQQQAQSRGVAVEEGWYYFLLGWSTVISYVYGVDITAERFRRFAAISEQIR
jgi:shikimate 5-dehydrogenase